MRKDVTTHEVRTAAALARDIQELDASLDQVSAVAAGHASCGNPPTVLSLRHALADEPQPRSLRRQIVASPAAANPAALEVR